MIPENYLQAYAQQERSKYSPMKVVHNFFLLLISDTDSVHAMWAGTHHCTALAQLIVTFGILKPTSKKITNLTTL